MTGEAIVDASVAVKWFVREDQSEEARDLAESGARLVAPAMIMIEVASALSKKSRRKLLTLSEAAEHVRSLSRFLDKLIQNDELVGSALALANELDHPIYDCLYVEAARLRGATLVTSDLRLLKKVGDLAGLKVVALSHWTTAFA